jgi:hypothetical protein
MQAPGMALPKLSVAYYMRRNIRDAQQSRQPPVFSKLLHFVVSTWSTLGRELSHVPRAPTNTCTFA